LQGDGPNAARRLVPPWLAEVLSRTCLDLSYHLRAAGIIALDLARQMLQLLPNTYVLVVSTENITQNWYFGNQKSMLIPNCLFRVGGAAMLLSNKRTESWWVTGTEGSWDLVPLCSDDCASFATCVSTVDTCVMCRLHQRCHLCQHVRGWVLVWQTPTVSAFNTLWLVMGEYKLHVSTFATTRVALLTGGAAR